MARVTCDGQCHPFSLVEGLRGGTHPLAVGPVNPGLLSRTGRSDRQRRWVPQKPGTRPTNRFAGQPEDGVSRFGGQAGTQAPTLCSHHLETGEAGPEALPSLSLPITSGRELGLPRERPHTDYPVLAVLGPHRDRPTWR